MDFEDLQFTMGAEELIELGRRAKKTIPLKKAERIARYVMETLGPLTHVVLVVGSIRRRRPEAGDVEFVVLPRNLDEFLKTIQGMRWTGGDRIQKKMVAGVPVWIYIAHDPKELGSMLFMYTGDRVFQVAMSSIAKRMGYTLNQYGIWDGDLPALQSPDERDFFDFLGVKWHDPEERSFKDRPKKGKKRATLGAEMLIELGGTKRKAGYINLELITPEEDQTDNWVLKIERIDPYGGDPWTGDFIFEEESTARYWFNSIVADDDIDHLISQMSHGA